MYKDKPSNTARKVALNIVTLGAKPGMDKVLPAGIVNATADLLVASGAVSATAVRWSRSRRMVWVYEAFDWMMKGQFEAFGHRKAFCERQVREEPDWTGLVLWILKIGGEPWLWSILPEQLGGFLEEVQWTNAPDLVGSSAKHGIEYFGMAIR